MRSRLLLTLPTGQRFGDIIRNIPGGVIDSVVDIDDQGEYRHDSSARLRLLAVEKGALRAIDVAPAACGAGFAVIERVVVSDWPSIVLETGVLYPGEYRRELGPTWISEDGGATFRQEGECYTTWPPGRDRPLGAVPQPRAP
jgi:hypothetical protein